MLLERVWREIFAVMVKCTLKGEGVGRERFLENEW
jgi:hypothetical protein